MPRTHRRRPRTCAGSSKPAFCLLYSDAACPFSDSHRHTHSFRQASTFLLLDGPPAAMAPSARRSRASVPKRSHCTGGVLRSSEQYFIPKCGVCSAAIHPRFHGHVHHIYRSAALHCSRAAVFADFAQVHYIVENTMAFLRSGLACCILVMGTTLLATVEMTRADDPSAPWTTRALRQTASDYWTAPPSAVRVCVLDSSPVVSAKVPGSIPPGTVLSPAKAKEVGPRNPASLQTACFSSPPCMNLVPFSTLLCGLLYLLCRAQDWQLE